jgi:hypothetical protein
MKRAIQRWIDDSLTDTLLENPETGSTFLISYDSENDVTKIQVKKPGKSKRTKKGDE